MVGGDALVHQEAHHRNGACGGQLPVRGKLRRVDRHAVGVAVDAQHPRQVLRNPGRDLVQGPRQLGELPLARFAELGRAGLEQDLRLEHEAVADDAHVLTVAEHLAQPAEELRTVARQLLHLGGERDVQAPAKVGDLDLLLLVRGLGHLQRGRQIGELLAQRHDLAVEQQELRLGRVGQLFLLAHVGFGFRQLGHEVVVQGLQDGDVLELGLDFLLVGIDDLVGVLQLLADLGAFGLGRPQAPGQVVAQLLQDGQLRELHLDLLLVDLDDLVGVFQLLADLAAGGFGRGEPGLDRVARFGQRGDLTGERLADAQRGLQLRGQLRDVDAQIGVGGFLQGEQLGQVVDLAFQAGQRLVPAAQRDRQEVLRDHEDHEDEDDDQQQRGQRVDEAGPDIDRPSATAPEGIHRAALPIRLLRPWRQSCGSAGGSRREFPEPRIRDRSRCR